MLRDYRGINWPNKVLETKSPSNFPDEMPSLDQLCGFILFSSALRNSNLLFLSS